MRGSIGRLASNNCTKQALISSSPFSTFAGGGGRGRGRGSSDVPNSQFSPPGKPIEEDTHGEADEPAAFPPGLGHGRGKPITSSPITPSFSSWMSGINPSIGRGRTIQPPPSSSPQESQSVGPKKPIFFRREDVPEPTQKTQFSDSIQNLEVGILPSSVLSGLPGAGRGKPIKLSGPDEKPTGENRHILSRPDRIPLRRGDSSIPPSSQSSPRLNLKDAANKAIGILSRGGNRMEDGGRGRGARGRRGRGRGRGGRGVQGWRGRGGRGGGRSREFEDDGISGLYLGGDADGEKLAQRIGPENMNKLTEAFEEMSSRVLPSPLDDAYLDALHTNNLIEYEPEYLMGEFHMNPDIDDKPPIPLRDALEKMKPFLMVYEGIKSQEEWEEIIEELMERVPHMKELMDIYSGPDRVTAKQQQQELERVAKTLPDNVPSSVKRYTDRAVLSLQSNPGWGWDKKCQFMDKLVWEVSQQYSK